MTPTLPNRIRDYLARTTTDGKWVTKEQIARLAISKGYTPLDVLDALGHVHRMGDVESRTHKDTIIYRIGQPKKIKVIDESLTYRPTPEEAREWAQLVEDFIAHSPLLTDEERECMRTPVKDRSDRCHELCDTPAGHNRRMARKYGEKAWRRLKEDVLYSGV